MLKQLTDTELDELRTAFADLINYDAEDPTTAIDPLTYRSPDGDGCLHIAAQRGDYRSVQLLLDAGVDPNSAGDMGQTALHYSRRSGHHRVSELLERRGASLTILDEFGKVP